jgi:hypothetical protein
MFLSRLSELKLTGIESGIYERLALSVQDIHLLIKLSNVMFPPNVRFTQPAYSKFGIYRKISEACYFASYSHSLKSKACDSPTVKLTAKQIPLRIIALYFEVSSLKPREYTLRVILLLDLSQPLPILSSISSKDILIS